MWYACIEDRASQRYVVGEETGGRGGTSKRKTQAGGCKGKESARDSHFELANPRFSSPADAYYAGARITGMFFCYQFEQEYNRVGL